MLKRLSFAFLFNSFIGYAKTVSSAAAFLILFPLLLSLPAVAQKIYVYPATVTAPRGSYQTVTAIVTGANDKTVTWTSDGGTIVGTNPCIVNEPCTVALTTTTPGTYHLTGTSNSNFSVSATSTITITGSPTPVATHPRLVITAAMLPALQAKATAGSPMYTGIQARANNLLAADNAIWSWSCQSGTGQPSSDQTQNWKEVDAYYYAFMSLVDPSATNRAAWGCYSRDIMVYMMNAVLNNSANPIDGPYGLTGNRGSDSTLQFALTIDWLMGGGYLSTSDLTTARQYFAWVGQNMTTTAITGTTAPIGNYNSSSQFMSGNIFDYTWQRAMGNNYTHSKEMFLVAAALTFNDTTTDDPPLANTCNATRYVVCPDGTAGSLHAYWTYLTGGTLYKDWAHVEDPNVSWQAYQTTYANLPTVPSCNNPWSSKPVPCFGDGRDGESTEGSWYRYSMYRSRNALNAIHTAGYDDPILYGPQMSYSTSSWWDLHYISETSFLTGPFGQGVGAWESTTACQTSCMSYFTTGDSNNYFRIPSDYAELSSTMVFDTYTGRTDRNNALEWPILNVAFGGPSGLAGEMANDNASAVAIDLFIALPAADPTTSSPPTDPRPAFPTDVFDAGNQHILARSGWTSTDTAFSYYCPNTAIDHEHEFCGRFDIFSKGEYITKGRTEFNDYNDLMSSVPQSNLAGYTQTPNTGCPNNNCFLYDEAAGGGQFWHSYQAGEVNLLHNESPTYVAAIVDTTNLYNTSATAGFNYWTSGVSAASRSLIYLRGPNQVVYYDRGITAAPQEHELWQVATGPLTITGNTASWPTRSGNQKVYYTSLISSGGKVADAGAYTGEAYAQNSDWEPYTRVVVDAGATTSTQFLSVLEWGDSSLTQTATNLVYSSSGANFDGAVIGSSLVMFMRNWPATFTSVTYPASQATTQYISDLAPNTTYAITGDGTPANASTDAAGVLTFSASGTGNITIGASTANLTSITVAPSSASVIALATQQYTATCNYSDGSTANCTSSVIWSSSATSAITINSSGLATGVAQGTANIIAANGSIQGQAGVTVNPPTATATATALQASPNTVTAGQTITLTAAVTATSGNPIGTVTFLSNGVALGSASVNSSGVATWPISSTTAGSYTFTAQYAGTSTFAASASSSVPETVNPASATATATALQASPNPVTAGQPITLTATVTATSGKPTGVVTFLSNGVALGSASVNSSGVATWPISSTTAGSYTFTAQYAGTSTFAASTSSSVAETVNSPSATATGTALQVSPNPVTAGQAITLTAVVTATSGNPTGIVTFLSNGVALGAASVNSSGVATWPISSTTAGSYTFTAQYAGTSTFAASTSSSIPETVNPPSATATGTALQASPNPVTAGQPITLTATVTATSGKPTGVVTFLSNGVALGAASVNSSGVATWPISSTTAGSYTFTAQYAGTSTFGASTSSSVAETVNSPSATATATVLQASPNTVTAGQAITLTAAVTATSGNPTGTVIFLSNGVALGAASVNSSGIATWPISSTTAGSYTFTAQYSGTSTFAASTSAPFTETVNSPSATTTATVLQVSPNPVTAGQAITLTATVTATSGNPTGTVIFVSNGAAIGAASVNSSGVATWPISSTTAGSYTFTAQYSGTSTFAASTSSSVAETVNSPSATPGVNLALSTQSLTVQSATPTSNSVVLTLTPVGGYSGTLQMMCATPPAGTTCTFEPSTIAVNSAPMQVNMIVKTSGTTAAAALRSQEPPMPGKAAAIPAAIFWIPGLLAAALIGKERKRLPGAGTLLLLLLLAGAFGTITGCGSGSVDILAGPQTTALKVMVTGTGNVNQSITLTVTTTP